VQTKRPRQNRWNEKADPPRSTLGVGDAYNLGWKLALVAKGQAYPKLLESYEAERYGVAKTVLRYADRGFALEVTKNPLAEWARANVATRLVGPLIRLGAVRNRILSQGRPRTLVCFSATRPTRPTRRR
jgi:2-polyprenyl-6-methoxyphenol hydroxylase-like FAD-dependent oxidoreductase